MSCPKQIVNRIFLDMSFGMKETISVANDSPRNKRLVFHLSSAVIKNEMIPHINMGADSHAVMSPSRSAIVEYLFSSLIICILSYPCFGFHPSSSINLVF